MDKLTLLNWKLNDKNQLEMDIKDNRHLNREEVGKRVELFCGEKAYEVRLFAIGLVVHGPGKPHGAAVKLKLTDNSKFSMDEVVKSLQTSSKHFLFFKHIIYDKPP